MSVIGRPHPVHPSSGPSRLGRRILASSGAQLCGAVRGCIALALVGSCLLAASGPSLAGDQIQIPLRWCALDGSPAVTNPAGAPVNPGTGMPEPDTDNVLWRRHERASDNITIPGADITFRSGITADIRDNASFPVVGDPCPPTTVNLCQGGANGGLSCTPDGAGQDPARCGAGVSCATQVCPTACTTGCGGGLGDVAGTDTFCQGGANQGSGCSPNNAGQDPASCGAGVTCARDLTEYNLAVATCTAAWDALADQWDTTLLGPVAVNIGVFRDPDGVRNGLKGRATGSMITASNTCSIPPSNVTAATGGAILAIDNQNFLASDLPFETTNERMVAHELGHDLFLWHGDGVDNDSNGAFDQACDSAENTCATPTTYMSSTSCGNLSTAMTDIQRQTARPIAQVYTGAVTDPPNIRTPSPAVGDQRSDRPIDVNDPATDLLSVAVIENQNAGTTMFTHRLLGIIPLEREPQRQYFVFADMDGNPETGGAPASIDVPSELRGVEVITRVEVGVGPDGEFHSVTPTLWRFVDGEFVECTRESDSRCALIGASLLSILGGDDSNEPDEQPGPELEANAVQIQIPNVLLGPMGSRIRVQALSRQVSTTLPPERLQLDRMPDDPAGATTFRPQPPTFPECGVSPSPVRPGDFATVQASRLHPDKIAKVFLGDVMVAQGAIDSAGNVDLTFQVPFDAQQGSRLVTVGVMGQAITADCPLQVAGEPLPVPEFEYAAKFVCGVQRNTRSMQLARGFYATVVNVHNPARAPVSLFKKLALAVPPGRQEPGQIMIIGSDSLGPDQAFAVDCDYLRERVFRGELPAPVVDGYLMIQSQGPLDVDAVYTTATLNAEGTAENQSSIHVQRIEGTRIGQMPPDGRRTDLVVRDIDLASLKVDCPQGGGSCVTTVPVTIANVGAAMAGPFNTRTVLDPGQAIVVDHSSPGGLAAGSIDAFTVTTPPGGNCFDPNCRICATVDSENAVPETNEANNTMCKEKPG